MLEYGTPFNTPSRSTPNPWSGRHFYVVGQLLRRSGAAADTHFELLSWSDHGVSATWRIWHRRVVPAQPAVTSVILGARTVEQIDDNLGAAGLTLTDDELTQLNRVSDPEPVDYPYGRFGTRQRSRQIN